MRGDLDALRRTVDDTLRLARAETMMASEFVPVDLTAIVIEAVELFEPLADHGLNLAIKTTPVTLGGVRSRLGQIVANLLDNAIKYTSPGGSIRMMLRRGLDGVTLIVADIGPGILADQRERAMTRFVRLDTSRHSEGSDPDLSIARVAARVHGTLLTLSDNAPGLRAAAHFPKA